MDTLPVAIYPINGDGNPLTDKYIASLTQKSFSRMDGFFKKQWHDYRELEFDPVAAHLQAEILSQPPTPPTDGDVLKVIIWSLRLRFWAYQNSVDGDKSTISIFVRYHQPRQSGPLAHSLGLQKGLIGVVNAYASADYQQRNNIVIAHELLHTVGASDKYSLTTGQPIYPDGFANPSAEYGQSKAEIMAGKIPMSENESVMPQSLRLCMIGKKTAVEIGWLSNES